MKFIKKNEKIIGILILGFIIIGGIYYNTIRYDELEEYGKITEAEIINFRYRSNARYTISYRFKVDGKSYVGSTSLSFFRCDESDNKRKGCIGKMFKLTYSSKDPNINEIDLGKYNRFKGIKPHF
ncbi:hypothetical protein [Winogradskyella jejuensis]|uniref:DUF3592 domain-containing protein n=1 Tax=Winogradskyella jejuensis TaxID=1089305 RepID=A0A1M5UP50_9FLAO|nr:hypothetical protein [Winogradskyella jejuensis]SHH64443.1 hypothetical protein SAMN05444148_2541 [Winogradskyella jejuensis]